MIMALNDLLLTALNPATFHGQLLQAMIQVLVWIHIFKHLKNYIKGNYSKSSWYLQGCKKGDGEPEFLMLFTAIPQHTISAFFVFLGYYFNSLQLFTMGTLGEFAFEFIEVYNILMAKYVYKNCPFKPEMVRSLMFHHIPGIVVIIPTNVYFGDNHYVQKISFSLLIIAPFLASSFLLFKTRNVYDLQQRGQFTVYYFITISCLIWFRFYWTPSIMIEFVYNEFMKFGFLSQAMFIFYGVLINLFNFTFTLILCQRLYGFMYGDKCVVETEDAKPFKAESPIPTMPKLQKSRSTPLYFDGDINHKKRN